MTHLSSPVNAIEWIARSTAPLHAALKKYPDAFEALHFLFNEMNHPSIPAQCARADIAKAIAYDLENGSAHGARVVTTPHLDNYHVHGHINLLALADAVLAVTSTDRGSKS